MREPASTISSSATIFCTTSYPRQPIVVSLALVAYELKLSRDLGRAALLQQSAATSMDYWATSNQNEPLVAAWVQLREDPSQLTKEQVTRLSWNVTRMMYQLESQFFTYRLGLIDDATWKGRRSAIQGIGEMPCYVSYWKDIASRDFRADFLSEVDQIWANTTEAACPL